MIGKMLFPLIKRYKKLFVSMVVISALAVAMLGMRTSIRNTYNAYETFKADYGYADAIINTELVPKRYGELLESIEGVKTVNQRIAINAYLTNQLNKASTAMICSYLDGDYYKRYEISKVDIPENMISVAVEERYAENNDIEAGQIISLYLYGTKVDVFVESLVYTPETMYVLSTPYLSADNSGFGYVFMSDSNLVAAIKQAKKENISLLWMDVFEGLTRHGSLQYANQILIKCDDDADSQKVLEQCKETLSSKVTILSSSLQIDTSSAGYMNATNESFELISKVLPFFFYGIALFIIVLFLNQMVLYMTDDIGVLMALGCSKWEIISLLSVFSMSMSICAVVLGIAVTKVLVVISSIAFGSVYQLPNISLKIDFGDIILAMFFTFVVGQLAVLISSAKIFRITPKDAMINNEAKKTTVSPRIEQLLDRFSPERKLNICFAIQNPRRVVVSIFSITAALMMLIVSFSFSMSKNNVIEQTFGQRFCFDVHFLTTNNNKDRVYEELSSLEGVDLVERIEYSTVKIKNTDNQELSIRVSGLYPDTTMLKIPDENGKIGSVDIQGEGIWLDMSQAQSLGIQAGDTIFVNDYPVLVRGLTNEYVHSVSAMTVDQLEHVTTDITTGYMIKLSDRTMLDQYLIKQDDVCVISNRDGIENDLNMRMNPLDIISGINVIFSLLMGMIVISMMSQASLTEQKRLISVMRVIGFTVKDISKMWMRQNLFYLFFGIILGIPMGLISLKLLIAKINNASWNFPFICNWLLILLAVVIVIVTVMLTHFSTMKIIRKWNLADNTRSKE